MYCQKCGTENNDSSAYCQKCGMDLSPQKNENPTKQDAPAPSQANQQQPVYDRNRPNISNHLIWAILATIFCCLPTGIVAIVYSAQVNGHIDSGRYKEAQKSSNNAKTWCWVSLGLGILGAVLGGILIGLGAMTSWTGY